MTAREVLDQIEQRASLATRGDWQVRDDNEGTDYFPLWVVANDEFYNPPVGDEEHWEAIHACVDTGRKEDAEFIAHARTDVPKLVAALRTVLDLHRPIRVEGMDVCWTDGLNTQWPCKTVSAITEALGADA